MSTEAWTGNVEKGSPLFLARMGGFCWLMTAVTGTAALLAGGRVGIAANAAASAFYVGATLFVYALLKPVDRSLSRIAASASLLGCAAGAASGLLGLPAAANIATLCFGVHCLLVGCLILRSTFMPSFVGALMVMAGLGWLTQAGARFLSPPLGRSLGPSLMAAGIFGELTLTAWLLVKGVDARKWNEQAASSEGRRRG